MLNPTSLADKAVALAKTTKEVVVIAAPAIVVNIIVMTVALTATSAITKMISNAIETPADETLES